MPVSARTRRGRLRGGFGGLPSQLARGRNQPSLPSGSALRPAGSRRAGISSRSHLSNEAEGLAWRAVGPAGERGGRMSSWACYEPVVPVRAGICRLSGTRVCPQIATSGLAAPYVGVAFPALAAKTATVSTHNYSRPGIPSFAVALMGGSQSAGTPGWVCPQACGQKSILTRSLAMPLRRRVRKPGSRSLNTLLCLSPPLVIAGQGASQHPKLPPRDAQPYSPSRFKRTSCTEEPWHPPPRRRGLRWVLGQIGKNSELVGLCIIQGDTRSLFLGLTCIPQRCPLRSWRCYFPWKRSHSAHVPRKITTPFSTTVIISFTPFQHVCA